MTFFSNRIYRINADGSQQSIGSPLSAHDRHGAYALAEWARGLGLPEEAYDYIDNCWLKLTVSPADLAKYLRAFAKPGGADDFIAQIDCEHGLYLIEAEEF